MFQINNTNQPKEDTQQDKTDNDFRKKRDEYTVNIRKAKRDEMLTKKRNRNLEIDQKISEGGINVNHHNLASDDETRMAIAEWLKRGFTMAEFLNLVESANSNDRLKQHYGVIGLRKILSNEQGPPIQHVIDANMVPRLIYFMQKDDEPHLQLEAAWALTNIASGTTQQTQSIIDKGGIPCFIKLLKTQRIELAEQAIWAIGNIAGDSAYFRDLILKYGGLTPLIDIVRNTNSKVIIKHGTWAISNLCRGKPLPAIELVQDAIPTLSAVMQTESSDVDVLTDAAWALSYLSRQSSKATILANTGISPYLVNYLGHAHLPLLIPCLRTIGNIVTGTEQQTDLVLSVPDFLPKVFTLVGHKKKAVQREALWTLSNITAGTAPQIERVMGVPEYVEMIMHASMSDEVEIQREAVWILSNSTKNCTIEQVVRLVENKVLDCFIHHLGSKDAKTVEVVLEGINNILNWGALYANQTGSTENQFLVVLEAKKAVEKIEALQEHPNTDVYLKALKILENHFELDSLI